MKLKNEIGSKIIAFVFALVLLITSSGLQNISSAEKIQTDDSKVEEALTPGVNAEEALSIDANTEKVLSLDVNTEEALTPDMNKEGVFTPEENVKDTLIPEKDANNNSKSAEKITINFTYNNINSPKQELVIDGVALPTAQTVESGSEITLPVPEKMANATKSFVGWDTDGDNRITAKDVKPGEKILVNVTQTIKGL